MKRFRRKQLRGLGMERLICTAEKTTLSRVRLNRGGYDSSGRYFGQGEPLFAYDNAESWGHVRAATRAAAKAKLKAKCPILKFVR